MTSVSFIRRSEEGGGGNGCVGGSLVRIAFSPRRRNYRAMSAASQHSCTGITIVSSSATNRRDDGGCCARCCGRLPVLFERSAGTWWDPKFDSEVLEGQLRLSCLPQVRRRLRCALIYAALAAAAWGAFLTARSVHGSPWLGVLLTLLSVGAIVLVFPLERWFVHQHRIRLGAFAVVLLLCGVSLLPFLDATHGHSPPLASFCACIQVLFIVYTAIPLPLYACSLTALAYSSVFELLSAAFQFSTEEGGLVALRLLAHVATHLIGMHIFIMTQVRARNTFLKVGQSAMVRRELEVDKLLQDKMINSVMPPSVAHWLLTEGPADEEEVEMPDGTVTVRKLSSPRGSSTSPATAPGNELRSLFRPFNMNRMDNVSILFADIVGFTRMSSDKSAEQLVGLLNNLFGRFDQLCERLGCEKISTLGDCYYCVSGCPEPRPDHARCCVSMGLSMIHSVRRFDEDTGEKVNMRVGVHTGTVLCGVVGTKRFKFDVWSHDVTLANRMESSGKPGRVHVSQKAYDFLEDEYYVEEGELYKGMKTYFIIGNKNEVDGITPAQDTAAWVTETPSIQTDSQQLEETTGEMENPVIIIEEQEALSPTNEAGMPKKSSLTQSWSTLNSRKDSGIRSRRSSIQAQLMESSGMSASDFLMGTQSKDYYKSISQLSVIEASEMPLQLSLPPEAYSEIEIPLNESLARLHLRKQSDMQMIKCIQQDSTHVDYFMKPPINKFSLFFTDSEIESLYRERAHCQENEDGAPTLASSIFSTYFDIFVAAVVYVITAFSCFILFSISLVWLAFFCLATCCQLLVLILCIRQMLSSQFTSGCLKRLYTFCTQWYPWHICGATLICLPIISVCANFSCELYTDQTKSIYFCYLIFISLMHFCNFTQLNCWMKSLLATTGAGILIGLLCSDVCLAELYQENILVLESLNQTVTTNVTEDSVIQDEINSVIFSTKSSLRSEAVLAILLLLLLVWYLNREFEIGYRISFHGSLLADRDQQKVQTLKDQADWLLHNIIPKHVVEHLKGTSKYSENHESVGIIFASIINFNELYDESYHGGKECLRVLNEVIGDFDELLHRPEFRGIEKIKTIGSTFMAASGLNPKLRQGNAHPYQHLFELLDFAVALQKVIEAFNADLLGFNFIIRIGYNFGDVTAGVIGTTKLYYDIWSDAVNIASRMDSTGVPGKIQVPEHCLPILEEYFEFEPRGSIYVKGKDNMNVYLLVRKKAGYEFRSPRKSDGGMSQHSVQFSH